MPWKFSPTLPFKQSVEFFISPVKFHVSQNGFFFLFHIKNVSSLLFGIFFLIPASMSGGRVMMYVVGEFSVRICSANFSVLSTRFPS